MNQNLYRPKISKDNTYISAEIHTFMSDIKDGYNNDMTIIFDNSESKDNLNGFYIKDKTDDDGVLSKTTNIEWSKQTDNLFFSTKFVDSDEDDNIEHSLFFNRLDSLYKDSNIASVTQANLNNFDKRLGLNYGKPSKINKYTISTPSDIEIDRTDNKWLTQLPIVHIIHNSQDNKTHSISTNHSSSKLNKVDVDINVLDMDVTLQRNEINEFKNSYNFLLTEEHNIYQSSIYLSCSMSSRNFLLQLYPNNQSKMLNQIEPTFNHNGTKAAFLSQSNDIGKHFDLYVVDISRPRPASQNKCLIPFAR